MVLILAIFLTSDKYTSHQGRDWISTLVRGMYAWEPSLQNTLLFIHLLQKI